MKRTMRTRKQTKEEDEAKDEKEKKMEEEEEEEKPKKTPKKTRKTTKSAKKEVEPEEEKEEKSEESDEEKDKKGKTTTKAPKKSLKEDQLYDKEKDNDEYWENAHYTDYTADFKESEPKLESGEMKIVTFNVAGWKAAMGKGLEKYIKKEDPDIICFQETKLQDGVVPTVSGYNSYFSASTAKKGYAGTAILTKEKPITVTMKLDGKLNEHGRIITAEYEKFYLVNTYVMNSGVKLENLKKRVDTWDVSMKKHLIDLSKKKKVIWCGDLNVALRWIDVAKPATRLRCAGFTKEERESASQLLEEVGLVDSFQVKHPKEKNFYTFFSFRDKAKVSGWRLDYFDVSKELVDDITQIYRRKEVNISDHVPLVIHIKK
ncbi:exodeoxyribonuclease III, putative [Entamoeba invadens IP1]|uniref:DNA-(apurinic or apyrimidinic site) endonuclease n=1 Tax=Entamoeba invadens IP1 TaxID=370355 RepID=A0A0A1UF46_ENTIV|nr:exodeoxyribonuclease III, putative [Entamoeba invadens IP1]ELP95108.1 exodeoxyribonuclease III, putative [Entamoeba invadens IP1]|eukprot:XP_004261879.1 exodeoxyribonuclease III, putative [Entamoeba invadens IP1]